MPKPKKVYKQGRELIVCHGGSHYLAPSSSRVRADQRVPVIPGEEPDTVVVLGETWTLKGTYTSKASGQTRPTQDRRKRSKAPKVVSSRPEVEPLESVLELIAEVAPSDNARMMLETCYRNWCRQQTHLNLYQRFHYPDPEDTRLVRELGRQIMSEHGVNR